MKVTGIITEYNPMHNGHLHHLNATREKTNSDAIICVMSGNFVQRGLPSILDKWTKAKLAIENGVDLVIELPTVYAISSAEFFSYGAVSLLDNLNIVDSICFGSEYGDIEELSIIARLLSDEPLIFKNSLDLYLEKGNSFAKARSMALCDILNINNTNIDFNTIINSPNNILGIEYIKSLQKLKSKIQPFTIQRKGSDYNSKCIENIFSSATSIRNHLRNKKELEALKTQIPSNTYNQLESLLFNNFKFPDENDFYEFIKYKIYSNPNSLLNIPDISEGLHNRIIKSVLVSNNYQEFIYNIKSKRYALSRIQRIICQLLIGFNNYDVKSLRKNQCSYARILGFNNKGQQLLRRIKKESSIDIISKPPKYPKTNSMKIDLDSTKIYSLFNDNINPTHDYYTKPIIIKE
ncbi:nucleotidyltransferase [Clostridium sp. DL1XJH146]